MAKQGAKTTMPRLRFPAFSESGDWRVGPLAQLATVVAGQSPAGANYNEVGEGLPFYQGKSEFGSIYLDEPVKWTTQITKTAARGDILMSVRAPVGALNVTTQEICIGRGLAAIKPEEEKWFLYYLLDSISGSIIGNGGSVFDSINKDQIEKLRLSWPADRAEQQEIADCLTSLDEVIAAQGRKLDALKAHKRGLMQQLFPREGETRPRLRFPEFCDAPEWEVKKLSASINLVSGMHLSPDQYSSSGDVPYFTGPSDFTNDVDGVTKWTSTSSSVAKEHDTLITVKGSGVGECWYLGMPSVAMGRQLMAVRSNASSSQFIHQFLLTKRSRFEDLASGNLIPGLARGDILDMVAPFPKKDEQKRIADCLSSLDTRIAAEYHQLAALKTHKQGLMQQLFPAPEEAHA